MQWKTLFQKELLENWRNYKIIWVPLVFIVIMIIDPIINYFLPEILKTVGGLPEGAVFEIPTPTKNEALMMPLSQLNSLGTLIIVLISMGTISEEKKTGITEIILSKPVTAYNYVTSKWISALFLVLSSFFVGLMMTWYYISLLYDKVSFSTIGQIGLFYSFWLIFTVSLVLFFNSLFHSQGLVAFLSLICLIMLSSITALLSHKLTWSPFALSRHIEQLLKTGEITPELIGSSVIATAVSLLLVTFSIFFIQRREVL